MRIEDLRTERNKNRSRIVATIVWEDSDRGRQDIYFETTNDFANGLTLGPHPFLLAGIMPALEYGEKRILIKEDICPELKEKPHERNEVNRTLVLWSRSRDDPVRGKLQ